MNLPSSSSLSTNNPDSASLFKIQASNFNPSHLHIVQESIEKLLHSIEVRALDASIVALITQLYEHANMENYRYIFVNYMIREMGMEYLDIVEVEDLFEAELKSSRVENFKYLSETHNVYTYIEGFVQSEILTIRVVHSGRLTPDRARKIQNTVRKIDHFSRERNLHRLGDQSGVLDNYSRGLPLALLTFRGLGLSDDCFSVQSEKNQTIYTVRIPLNKFFNKNQLAVINQDTETIKNLVWDVFNGLQISMVRFNSHGSIIEISRDLLNILKIPEYNIMEFSSIIPESFFTDLFTSPFSIHNFNSFENYRITLPVSNTNQFCLFNISGVKKADSTVVTLWQVVNIDTKKDKFTRGSMFENIHMLRLISPYIPKMVLEKAKVSLKKGLSALPVELEKATIFFADLAGFTHNSENMSHIEIVELLNLTMANIVSSIDRYHGYVDKYIGDGIMCIFFDALSSVVAGIEIQNNLMNLNQFRKLTGQPPLELRIGINSGNVIMGSIGTKDRMDWTALGDVVNTAARIETGTPINNVAISETTYEIVKENIKIKEDYMIKLKGKEKEQKIYLVSSANFEKDNKKYNLELTESGLDLEEADVNIDN